MSHSTEKRLVTLCTCQWADMEFESLCGLAKEMGYDGLEIAVWGNSFDLDRALRASVRGMGRFRYGSDHGGHRGGRLCAQNRF